MISRLIPLLVLLVSPLSLAFSPSSTPQIRGQLLLSNHTSPLDLTAQITLGGKSGYTQLAKIYGSTSSPPSSSDPYHFKFTKPVPNGDYVLRIESRKYEFQSYFVRVSEAEGIQTGLFDERFMRMYPGSWLPHPLLIRPIQEFPLDDLPPPSMSLINMLKSNPLIWLIGLGLIMVGAIPKLMENLDPETLREVQQSQKEMHKNMASLQSFDSSSFSKFLSGSATSMDQEVEPGPPVLAPAKIQASTSASSTGTRTGGGGKGKKRK